MPRGTLITIIATLLYYNIAWWCFFHNPIQTFLWFPKILPIQRYSSIWLSPVNRIFCPYQKQTKQEIIYITEAWINIFEKKLESSDIELYLCIILWVQSHPQAYRWQIKCNILIVPPPLFISHWEHTVREARSKWLHLIYASENISEKPFPQFSAWLSYFSAVHLYHQSWSSQSTVGKKKSVCRFEAGILPVRCSYVQTCV